MEVIMQNENPVIQSIRINPSDKETFAEISKQLGIPHHESFNRMVALYKKMYELEDQAPDRIAQAKEVTVLFERLVGIYEDVLTSNDTLKEQMVEAHTKTLSEKDKKLQKLVDECDAYKTQLKEKEAALDALRAEKSDLNIRIQTAEASLEKTTQIETYKDTLIENLKKENKALQINLEAAQEEQNTFLETLKPLGLTFDQLILQHQTLIEDKTMYVSAFDQMKKDLKEATDQTLALTLEKKELELKLTSLTEHQKQLIHQIENQTTAQALERERIKSEYKELYETQMNFLRETYDNHLSKAIQKEVIPPISTDK